MHTVSACFYVFKLLKTPLLVWVRFRQRLPGDCLQRPDAPPLAVGGAPGRTRGLEGDLIGNQQPGKRIGRPPSPGAT
jgi:hypothetical protein